MGGTLVDVVLKASLAEEDEEGEMGEGCEAGTELELGTTLLKLKTRGSDFSLGVSLGKAHSTEGVTEGCWPVCAPLSSACWC